MFKRLLSVQSLLWLALLLALTGSLRHVAWGFSTLEQGDIMAGYVQAVAVDVGLFALAIGIQQRRRQARSTFVLWIGVIVFAGLSTYANLLHGVVFKSDINLSRWTSNDVIVLWLDFLRPVLMSGVLPLLVVYLSEIAGSDVSYQLDLDARECKARERRERQGMSSTTGFDATPEAAECARKAKAIRDELSKAQALDAMLTIYQNNPNAGPTEIAQIIGKSRTTVYSYINELEKTGRIRKDGDGVEVLVSGQVT